MIGRPHGGLEAIQRLMLGGRFEVRLRAAAPQEHAALQPMLALEVDDVLLDLLGQIHEVAARLVKRAVDAPVEAGVVHAGPRPDGGEFVRERIEEIRFERSSTARRLIGVGLEDIPTTEHQIVEVGELHEISNGHVPRFSLRADVDRSEERERSDGLGHAFLDRLDARDECRADRAKSTKQHTDAPGRGAGLSPSMSHNRFRDVIFAAAAARGAA